MRDSTIIGLALWWCLIMILQREEIFQLFHHHHHQVAAFTFLSFAGGRVVVPLQQPSRRMIVESKKTRTLLLLSLGYQHYYKGEDDDDDDDDSFLRIGAVSWNSTTIDAIRDSLVSKKRGPSAEKNDSTAAIEAAIIALDHPHVAVAALCRFTQHLSRRGRIKQDQDAMTTVDASFQAEFLPVILKTVESAVFIKDDDNNNELCSLNVLIDALVSILLLLKYNCLPNDKKRLEALAKFIWRDRLQQQQSKIIELVTKKASPARMVDCVRAGLTLNLAEKEDCWPLFQALLHRLAQGDALARLTPAKLSGLVVTYSRRHDYFPPPPPPGGGTAGKNTTTTMIDSSFFIKLITAFTRRLRKQNVRSNMNTEMLLWTIEALSRLVHEKSSQHHKDTTELISELKTGACTLIKHVLVVRQNNDTQRSNDEDARTTTTTATTQQHPFVVMFDAVERLDLAQDHPIRRSLYMRLWDDAGIIIASSATSLRQVAHLQKVFLHANNTKNNTDLVVRQVGARLVTEASYSSSSTMNHHLILEPGVLSSLLRYAVLSRQHQPTGDASSSSSSSATVQQLYQDATRCCIMMRPAFLMQSNALHVSNFCWFMYMTRWNDEDVLNALARRTLEPDFWQKKTSCCTPKIACRLMAMYTGIFETRQKNGMMCSSSSSSSLRGRDDDEIDVFVAGQEQSPDLLSQLFHCLGEHLLSTNMTTLDLSSAINAYAKASYVQDMGIFDHLVELFTLRVHEATTRQVAQTLWACGKIVGFEGQEHGDEDRGVDDPPSLPQPPYYSNSVKLARHLSSITRLHLMTTKDVAQSLWSLGRLGITDGEIVMPLVRRVQELSKDLNTHEVSNILWAMSRIRVYEYATVFALTRRFAVSDRMPNVLSSQEAANILYSLGRLDIRDEDVFRNLAHAMMQQIDDTSAQAVANVLWAHRAVLINPPQELLDLWANKKLGIVPVRLNYY